MTTGTPWLRALLGFVFLFAAVSKVRDPAGFGGVLGALGIECPSAREGLKVGVPLAEAGLGLWLWTAWRPVVSATTAGVVLVLLTLVLVKLRRVNYTGACGCFPGEGRGVGTLTLARNVVLIMACVWAGLGAYVDPGANGFTSPSVDGLPLLGGIATVVALGAYAILTRRDPRPGADATDEAASQSELVPPVERTDLAGARVVLGRPKSEAQLVVFAKGGCPGCIRDREVLNRLLVRPLTCEIFIVCGGDLQATTEFASEVRMPIRVVADPRWRTAVAWRVTTTPFTVLVDRHGRVQARGPLSSALTLLAPEAVDRGQDDDPSA